MAKLTARVGSLGQTVGDLRPSGKVRVDDTVYEARSEGQWIDAGRQVVVVSFGPFGLVVREATAAEAAGVAAAETERVRDEATARNATSRRAWRRSLSIALAGGAAGAAIGLGVIVAGRLAESSEFELADLAYPGGGFLAGVVQVFWMRVFHGAARGILDEDLTPNPGMGELVVAPAGAGVLGAVAGWYWAGLVGATYGALIGGFVVVPLVIALFIIVTQIL
jgi:hypothetical protein